jgi:hypothetical protein
MTFTFSNNPAESDRDKVRILLHDTSSGPNALSDETVDWLISAHPNVWFAAAAGAGTKAARLSEVAEKQVGDLRIRYRDQADGYGALAKSLRLLGVRRVAPHAGGISESDKAAAFADSDMTPPKFRTDQFTNPSSTGAEYVVVY